MSLSPRLAWLTKPNLKDSLAIEMSSGRLTQYLSEVACLYGVEQNPVFHPEVDTGIHIELCLDAVEKLSDSRACRLAVLLHDLGKGVTPKEFLPKHHQHEIAGIPLVKEVCARLGASDYETLLCTTVCEWHLSAHPGRITRPSRMWAFYCNSGLLNPNAPDELVTDFFLACLSDCQGRKGSANHSPRFHRESIALVSSFRKQSLKAEIESLRQGSSEQQQLLKRICNQIDLSLLHLEECD